MSENAYKGLPQADDYDPDSIGTANLEAGEAEQTWEEFGLELVPVLHDGEDTGRRIVRRNGDYLSMVSDRYKLLPNEQAVAAANEVARDLGAVPFHDFDGDWYVTLDDHVFQDEDRRRVHALYAWDDPVEVTDGDTVQFGFAVHNSIDGSMSFETGLFTFRHACANMVMMGAKGQGMSFDNRNVIHHSSHRHTASLEVDVEGLKARVETMLAKVEDVQETYQAWVDNFLTADQVRSLIRRIEVGQLNASEVPAWAEDVYETIQTAEENEQLGKDGEWLDRAEIIKAEMPQAETVWDSYNDLTENIWHNPSTNDRSKRAKMKDTHRVFAPAQGIY